MGAVGIQCDSEPNDTGRKAKTCVLCLLAHTIRAWYRHLCFIGCCLADFSPGASERGQGGRDKQQGPGQALWRQGPCLKEGSGALAITQHFVYVTHIDHILSSLLLPLMPLMPVPVLLATKRRAGHRMGLVASHEALSDPTALCCAGIV